MEGVQVVGNSQCLVALEDMGCRLAVSLSVAGIQS